MAEKAKKARKWAIMISYDYWAHDKEHNLIKGRDIKAFEKYIADILKNVMADDGLASLAYIVHDRDKLDDGKIKPLHYHLIAEYKTPRSQSSMIKRFNVSREENCQAIKVAPKAWQYLTHRNDKAIKEGKHVYDVDEVHCYKCNYMDKIEDKHKKSSDSDLVTNRWVGKQVDKVLNSVIDGIVNLTHVKVASGELLKVDAQEFIEKQYRQYVDDCNVPLDKRQSYIYSIEDSDSGDSIHGESYDSVKAMSLMIWTGCRTMIENAMLDYQSRRGSELIAHGRHLKVFYIGGLGGTGKSALAQGLARQYSRFNQKFHKASVASESKTYDPIQTYEGENVSIFDDMDPQSMGRYEFRNMFDNYQYAPASVRVSNRNWLADVAIITNATKMETFMKYNIRVGRLRYLDYSNPENRKFFQDEMYQNLRRITYEIECVEDSVEYSANYSIYAMNEKSKVHEHLFDVKCPNVIDDNVIDATAKRIKDFIDDYERENGSDAIEIKI